MIISICQLTNIYCLQSFFLIQSNFVIIDFVAFVSGFYINSLIFFYGKGFPTTHFMFYSKHMKNMLVVKTFDDTNLIVKRTSSCIISSIHSGHGVLSWRLIYRGYCDNGYNKDLKKTHSQDSHKGPGWNLQRWSRLAEIDLEWYTPQVRRMVDLKMDAFPRWKFLF